VVDPKEPREWVEIVSVAKTGKYIWIAEQPMDFLYLPRRQYPRPRMVLLAESAGDSASLAAPLREAVRGLDANQPIFQCPHDGGVLRHARGKHGQRDCADRGSDGSHGAGASCGGPLQPRGVCGEPADA
jgi:hypothetical protein